MKRLLIAAAASIMALTGSVAAAQPYHYHPADRNHDGYVSRWERDRAHYHQRRWARGERLPYNYRTHTYIVRDYGRYGYRAPPPGYAYYRTDNGDVVLAAIATGIISAIIADSLHDRQEQHQYPYDRHHDYRR